MYTYRIQEVVKVYDADTITVVIDLGMNISVKETVRLYGINAPEIRGEERSDGLISRDWLRGVIQEAISGEQDMYIRTYKDKTGKYGRLLGEIFIGSLETVSLNDQLVSEGMAVYKDY